MAQDAARAYWRFTVIWLIIGTVFGIFSALSLFVPEFHTSHPLPGFGRLVAAHRASMVHGVLFSGVLALAYTLLPRLTQARTKSSRFSKILAVIGFLIVLFGILLITLGYGSGREYADLPAGFAILYWFYLMAVAVDISILLLKSTVVTSHPATGLFYLAAVLPAIVYPFALPHWWGAGLFDALRVWVSWKTIFIGSFGTAAIGAMIFYLGSLKPRPKLPSGAFLVGLGIIICLGPLVGITHLLDAPMWGGLKVLGAFAGVMVAAGFLILIRIFWRGEIKGTSSLLFFAGLCGLGFTMVQGIVLTIPPIHTAFHFTANTSAHAHLALGSIIMIFLSVGILVIPILSRRDFTGMKQTLTASGLLISGLILIFMFQTSAGVLQATAFINGLSVNDWLPMFRWLQLGVLCGGLIMLPGILILAITFIRNLGSQDRANDFGGGEM